MRKLILGITLCLALPTAVSVSAQNENTITIEDVTVINDGDGRALFRDAESEEPLNGLHRIIDGFHSAYILAEFTDGFYNGSFETYENSKLTGKGTYLDGREHGLFTTYHSDGKVAQEMSFTDGELDGVMKTYYPDGTLEKEQGFLGGEADGIARSYYPDGSLQSEKGFKAGKEHGYERSFRHSETEPYIDRNWFEGEPDGRQYAEIDSNTGDYVEVAHFDRGVPTGEFLQTWADSGDVKQRGRYRDGKKEGVWTEIRRDGKIESEITWADGKRNGPSKAFFTDNSIEKITMYVDDKREGIETTFRYDSGRITSEINYANDRQEGEYRRYYDDIEQTLREEGRIERGNEVFRKEYYSNGQLKRIQERPVSAGSWKTLKSYDEEGRPIEL